MLNRRIFGIGQLGRRLVLAFIAVALAAIAVNSFVSAKSLGSDITRVVMQQEDGTARAVAATSGAAYDEGGWTSANLRPAFDLARQDGAGLQLRDVTGRVIGATPRFTSFPGDHQRSMPVTRQGRLLGWVTVRFGHTAFGAMVRDFEARRWHARLIAGSIAALLALLVSIAVARAISGPLELMLEAVRARGSGVRSVRIRKVRGVGVVRELLESFNQSAAALDHRDRLQRNLIADVAHELRTPVAVLQASHEAMLDGVTDPTPDNLGSMREEVLRLASMVEDLQRLAAAEAAAVQLTLAPHDLAAIAAEAADSLRGSYGAGDVGLVQRMTQVHVASDPGWMREVVLNLLTNALKFTPPEGRVRVEAGSGGDGLAVLRITDTGIGIPPADLPHVTERFFRSDRSTELAGGSGIGLTIVAELVRAQGGELEIASEPDKGTEVTVTFPAVDAAYTRRLALLRSAAQRI